MNFLNSIRVMFAAILFLGFSGRVHGADLGTTAVPKRQVLPSPMSKDIAAIAWVDPSRITLPTGANPYMVSDLNDSFESCAHLIGLWANFLPTDISYPGDINAQYAIAWLLKNSPNTEPPPYIGDVTAAQNAGDFRLFNHLKAEVQVGGGQIVASNFLVSGAAVGYGPEPCSGFGIPAFVGLLQTYGKNGQHGISDSGSTVYQLNEARIPLEPGVNAVLFGWGHTLPWMWTNIQLDANANLVKPYKTQIFPTYYFYTSGVRTDIIRQSDPYTFFALDESSVLANPQK